MLRLVSDHLKTKRMCKHVVKKWPFIIKYVPDQYKTQRMCYKVILKIVNMFTLDCYKDKKICNKAVNNHAWPLRSVSDCYKYLIKLSVLIFLQSNSFWSIVW